MTSVAIIGLGEAGGLYARGMKDTGFVTVGYDPFTRLGDDGIVQLSTIEGAVAEADLVLSLVGARAASDVGEQATQAMKPGAVFADLNTGTPELKAQMESDARGHDIQFADVAVLAPVPRDGIQTPLMVSGDGADAFAVHMIPTGAPVESIGGKAGDAAARKLLRSVFMKGLAAVILESVTAAEIVGQNAWVRQQIETEFSGNPEQLIERLLAGSQAHAERRVYEAEDAAAFLRAIGSPTWSVDAAHAWLSKLRDESQSSET
jgi:3-hydroxyisobutyrate dehydrogenase-like beta-hydroxyacid dehydrogenase